MASDLIVEIKIEQKNEPINKTIDRIKGMVIGSFIYNASETANSMTWHPLCDHMLLVMSCAYFDDNSVMRLDNKLFASKLVLWRYNKSNSNDKLVSALTSHPKFTINPKLACIEVHTILTDEDLTTSMPLIRMAPLALSKDYKKEIIENCCTTNFDSRCLVSCLVFCQILRHLIQEVSITENIIKNYCIENSELAGDHRQSFELFFNNALSMKILPSTEIFNLHEKSNFILNTLATALWGLRCAIAGWDYASIINAIKKNSNDELLACASGTMIGAYLGCDLLPSVSTEHKKYFNKIILEFLSKE